MNGVLARCFYALDERASIDPDPDVPDRLNRYSGFPAQPKHTRYENHSGLGHTYINANWVDGKRYIATQAPIPDTMADFWWMVIQAQVKCVIMLTDFAEGSNKKADPYFPTDPQDPEMGFELSPDNHIRVRCSSLTRAKHPGSFLHRELEILYGGRRSIVEHLQYLDWPDGRVPANPHEVRSMLQMKVSQGDRHHPVVVHCSAGVGRAGTFLLARVALDRGIQTAAEFCKLLDELRQNGRMILVQTATQFIFAWKLTQSHDASSVQQHLALIAEEHRDDSRLLCEMCQLRPATYRFRHRAQDTPISYCGSHCQKRHQLRCMGSLCCQ